MYFQESFIERTGSQDKWKSDIYAHLLCHVYGYQRTTKRKYILLILPTYQFPYKFIEHLPVPFLALEFFIEAGTGEADGRFGAFQDGGHTSEREIGSTLIDSSAEVW